MTAGPPDGKVHACYAKRREPSLRGQREGGRSHKHGEGTQRRTLINSCKWPPERRESRQKASAPEFWDLFFLGGGGKVASRHFTQLDFELTRKPGGVSASVTARRVNGMSRPASLSVKFAPLIKGVVLPMTIMSGLNVRGERSNVRTRPLVLRASHCFARSSEAWPLRREPHIYH